MMAVLPVNIAEQQMKEKCKNCGLTHPPRKCPAYRDTCRACGKKNHWKNVCRSKHSHYYRRNKEGSRKLSHQKKKKKQETNEFGNSDSENTNSSDSDEQFNCVQIPVLSRTMRKEAFTNLLIRLPQKKSKHKLKLKIDSGAAGNTLPVRTIGQMYGDKYKDVIQRAHNIRLTAYNGQDIPCLGSISISIKKQKSYIPAKFYLDDVPGPAIVGLSTYERLELITINCNAMKNKPAARVNAPTADLKSEQDLKNACPKQFDTLGDFEHPAKLFIKKDARPFIDPPRKCPIHIKKKLRLAHKKMETSHCDTHWR